MKRLALIGYGRIAPKHLEVFRALGAKFVAAVNRSSQGRERACNEGGIRNAYSNINEMLDRERPDAVLCCVSPDQIYPVAKVLMPRAVPMLLEKPAGTSWAEYAELNEFAREHRACVMPALNRRHYSVLTRALDEIGGPSALHAVFVEWSEDPGHLKQRGVADEQIARWVFSNSIHGLDLLTHLTGGLRQPAIRAARGQTDFAWYMAALGHSERNVLCEFHATWGSPGRWRLNLCSAERRYVFAPLESCEVLERGSATPRLIEPDACDRQFKPGFYRQAELFLQAIDEGRPPAGHDLASVGPAMQLAEQLTEACLQAQSDRASAPRL